MNKRILIIFAAILVSALGGWIIVSNTGTGEDIAGKKAPETEKLAEELPDVNVDLSLSPLGSVELPAIDFSMPIDLNSFGLDLPGAGEAGIGGVNISAPQGTDINFTDSDFSGIDFGETSAGAGETGGAGETSGSGVNAETCQRFSSAPSCSYVPAQYQDLCEQCEAAGF